jgi:hypothetical protein
MTKVTKKKPAFDHFLRWKMGASAYDRYVKGKRIDDLLPLFKKYNDVVVAPLIIPEETYMPLPLPHISETKLGESPTKFIKEAVLPSIKNTGR